MNVAVRGDHMSFFVNQGPLPARDEETTGQVQFVVFKSSSSINLKNVADYRVAYAYSSATHWSHSLSQAQAPTRSLGG